MSDLMSGNKSTKTKPKFVLVPSSDADRRRAFNTIVILALLGGLPAGLANIWLFIQEGAWQMLAVGVIVLISMLLVVLGYLQGRRGNFDAGALLALLGAAIGLGVGELFHQGLTLFLAISGMVSILLIGLLTMLRRWWVWFTLLILYGLYFWGVNLLKPFPRYNVADIGSFQVVVIIIVMSLAIIISWQFFRVLRFGTIRTRLLITFVILVLIPAAIIGTVSSVLNAQHARRQVLNQLESIVTLKETEVQAWSDGLVSNLLLAMPSVEQYGFVTILLNGPENYELGIYDYAYEREMSRFVQIIEQGQIFDEMFLVNLDGTIMFSTDETRVGLNEYGYPYFDGGLAGPFVSPQYRSPQTDERIITVAAPVPGEDGQTIGLLAGLVNPRKLESVMGERAGLGETGETYLVAGRDLRLLTVSRYEGFIAGVTYPLFSEGIQQAAAGNEGSGSYENYAGVPVFGAYRYNETLNMMILAEQGQSEALASVTQAVIINVGATVGVVVLAILVALFMTNRITTPIAGLAQTAEKIAAGDLQLDAPALQQDEIGALARSFNTMTSRLRQTLAGLEQQVADRTAALALRSSYLQAAADVSRAVTSVLEPNELIQQVVELIRERFGLYYVGLFTVNETGEWAILRAGTGEAGKVMLDRGHRLKVGVGMIGWSVANMASRIALHAELDEARLANPLLPDTRSEAAIPLRSRGRVIGAITVQSEKANAFDEATVAVFETMADQVGIALDNARLFSESQEAIVSLSRAYGDQAQAGWLQRIRTTQDLGYRSDVSGNVQKVTEWAPELELVLEKGGTVHGQLVDGQPVINGTESEQGDLFLGVPVVVRDHVIGVINGYKSADSGKWSESEIDFMNDVASIVSIALENARLYEDTQRKAESERIAAEVSDRIRQSLDVDTVMQTAVVELQRTLGLKDITIRLGDTNGQ